MLEETDMQRTKLWAKRRGYLSWSYYMPETVQSFSKCHNIEKAQGAWLCQGEGDCYQAISYEVSLEKWGEFVGRKSTDHPCIPDRRKTAWATVSDDVMWMGLWVALGESRLNCIGVRSFPSQLQPIQLLQCLCMHCVTWSEQSAIPFSTRALITCQLKRGRLWTHLRRARRDVNQSHSEKVIKIPTVFYKPSASPEFSVQLLSHSLGAVSSLKRHPEQPWHFRIRAWAPSWLRILTAPSEFPAATWLLPCGGLCFGPGFPAFLCWNSQHHCCGIHPHWFQVPWLQKWEPGSMGCSGTDVQT